jgi:hypothetical protein
VTSLSVARQASQSDLLIDNEKYLGIGYRTDGLLTTCVLANRPIRVKAVSASLEATEARVRSTGSADRDISAQNRSELAVVEADGSRSNR